MTSGTAKVLQKISFVTFPIVIILASTGNGRPSELKERHSLHEPAEIIKIMEESKLEYELGVDDSLTPMKIESPRVLSSETLLLEDGGNYSLTRYPLSADAKEVLSSGENAYQEKDYESALKAYNRLMEMEPKYWHALVLIGDVHYSKGEFDKAKAAFEKAIKHNFVDYQAHWFLGDTLWNLGDQQGAIRSLTTAHLLNVNHEVLRKRLVSYRAKAERPWKDWTYEPRYSLKRDGDTIKVTFAEGWLGYAIVKAVWAFEPGYAHEMVGTDYEKNVITIPEEKEALVAELGTNHEMKHIEKIIDEGYANEFIYYELLARRAPETIVLLPREIFMRLVDYVDTYH